MNRYRLLTTFLFATLVSGSALPALSRPGSASHPVPVPQETRALTVALDGDGCLWAAWELESGTGVDLEYSRWDGEAWSAPRPVHHRPDAWDRAPSLAIAADGTPWLAWASSERAEPGTSHLYVSRWTGQLWTTPEQVPLGQALAAKEPALASAPNGRLWLAWVGFDGNDDEIFASRWDGAAWSSPWLVSADDEDPALYDRQPRLAVGKDGQPWVVWTGHQSGPDDEIYASQWGGTEWASETAISRDDTALDVSPALALDGKGQPWVAWKGRVTEGERSRLRILVSRWEASSATWTAETVASASLAQAVDEESPLLSEGSDGTMHLAWTVTGADGSALVRSQWQDGRWAEAQLVRAAAPTDAALLLVPHDESLELLWLNQVAGASQPVARSPIAGSAQPLSAWIASQPMSQPPQNVDPISNRYLAFGDSITCYPDCFIEDDYPTYPVQLNEKLDLRVAVSEVIESGKSGEGALGGSERITGVVSTYQPQYALLMEGTNDVTRDRLPADVYDNLVQMIDNATVAAGVNGVKVMLGTIIPRLDDLNDETLEMNQLAVFPAAAFKGVPVCDQYQAFVDTGILPWLFEDDNKHPNALGRQVIAFAFYDCLLAAYPELEEETMPPAAWIEPLPGSFECGESILVSWNGTDDLSWVEDYDVQVKVGDGLWTDWLLATSQLSRFYSDTSGGRYGNAFGFRVRGRDLVGNEGAYSEAAYTQVADSVPPYEAHVDPLPALQLTPFSVGWGGSDACADVVAYDTQYRVGVDGAWQGWLTGTLETSAGFDPSAPQSGDTYYFRARAQDQAGNWGDWSGAEAFTELVAYTLGGHVYNVRHQPVIAAEAALEPVALQLVRQAQGGFLAHLGQPTNYDVSVARDDRYGPLPATYGIAVDGHVNGPDFFLPPQDDVVTDGDFESGSLAAWQPGGSVAPVLTATVHSGFGAVQFDAVGHDSSLVQATIPGAPLIEPTLSLMVRLVQAGPASSLHIQLAGTDVLSPPITHTIPVESDEWTHIWRDLPGPVGEPLTLTLTVVGAPAIVVDEIRLGSSVRSGYPAYLPILRRE